MRFTLETLRRRVEPLLDRALLAAGVLRLRVPRLHPLLKRGKTGAFTLTLAAHITKATCDDADGKLIVTKGHATLTGLCGQPEVLTKGTATLK